MAKTQQKKAKSKGYRFLLLAGWALAIGFAAVGEYLSSGNDDISQYGRALYLVPLLARLTSWPLVRAYGIWFGFFLLAQGAWTLVLGVDDFRALAPRMNKLLHIWGDGIHGVQGAQQITTDGKGFRTSPELNYHFKRGLRVFAIGASTTEELFIDDRKTWTHLLQNKLTIALGRYVEIVNSGVSGTRARNHYATLKEAAKYDPDLVIILPGVNDWNQHIELGISGQNLDIVDYRELSRFKNSLLGRWLQRKLHPPVTTPSALEERDDGGGFYEGVRGSLYKRPATHEFRPDTVYESYEIHLKKIARYCQRAPFKCLIVNQPNAYKPEATDEMKARFWMTPPFQPGFTVSFDSLVHIAALYNTYTLKVAADYGLPSCDIAARIPPTLDHFFDDVHFNLNGSRAVSEEIFTCLKPVLGIQ